MPNKMKRVNKQGKNEVKTNLIGAREIEISLVNLAHAGTEEAVNSLYEFIQKEKNESLRDYAKIALEEAEFFYYSPDTDQEERDFLLARSIYRRQEQLWHLESKADSCRLKLQEMDLGRKVHRQIIKGTAVKEKNDAWKYNFSEEFYFMVKNRLGEIEDEMAYEAAWLKEAREQIKTKKYLSIPWHIFEHIRFDADAGSIWEDEEEKLENNHNKPTGLINYIDNPKYYA